MVFQIENNKDEKALKISTIKETKIYYEPCISFPQPTLFHLSLYTSSKSPLISFTNKRLSLSEDCLYRVTTLCPSTHKILISHLKSHKSVTLRICTYTAQINKLKEMEKERILKGISKFIKKEIKGFNK
mmetsp:Transcript_15519/g.13560  ORF Transcript_15519/g.13560 Transcript_15519/m.13560 type:complete len:129 (+) Transcript_15519:418-804(+)